MFYVYEHWRPDTNLPFYVGKGSGRRGWRFIPRNRYYKNLVDKLAASEFCVEVRLVAGELSEKQAYDLEVERIAYWRARGIVLTNRTSGGAGPFGPDDDLRVRTPIWKQRIGEGVSRSYEDNPELLEHRSRSLTGLTRSRETRDKISSVKRDPLQITRDRNSAAARQSWRDPNFRRRQIAVRLGVIRITDGKSNRTIRPEEPIPIGWERGMVKRLTPRPRPGTGTDENLGEC